MADLGPHLKQDILDRIIDFLHDEPETLRQCCLASKCLVPRSRTHLFGHIDFESSTDVEAWKKAFPDPTNSPAHYTRSLLVSCPEVVTIVDAQEGGWIRSFSSVVELEIWSGTRDLNEPPDSLIPFHNFSPVLKSLRLAPNPLSLSGAFNLICSLPLLEDLGIATQEVDIDGEDKTLFRPSTSPPLTGTLTFSLPEGMVKYLARRLLDLPNGLHFRCLVSPLPSDEDIQWVTALVEECSDTLEGVEIQSISGDPPGASIDLSKLTKLKKVGFILDGDELKVEWVTMMLKTITSKHGDLQKITILISDKQGDSEEVLRQWKNLDRMLVKLWELHGVRIKVKYRAQEENEAICRFIGGLLPKAAEKGIIKLVHFIE